MNGSAKSVDAYLADLPDWQRKNLELFRKLVHKVQPDIDEEIKWGVPVFVVGGKMVHAMSSFKAHTKYNFIANGASLSDPAGLFNNGLESKKSRSIDLRENETIDEVPLENLIRQALATM